MQTTSGNKIAMATLTAAYVNLQGLDDEKTALVGGVYGKTFVIYADINEDIREGDKIKDTIRGNFYKVIKGGVTKHSQGSIEYLKVVIRET